MSEITMFDLLGFFTDSARFTISSAISWLVLFNGRSLVPTCMIKIVLIATVALPLSSNKLGKNVNCDTNLLMSMSLLLIFLKKVLYCNLLATKNHFWSRQELKCEFQVRYLKKRDFLLTIWTRRILYKRWTLSLKSSNHNFRTHEIWTRKTIFFTVQTKATSNSRQNRN